MVGSTGAAGSAVGYGLNSALGLTSFAGQAVDSTSLLIQPTFAGDANLDGVVDATDLGALAMSWGSTSGDWIGGDFNYDGVVDVNDLDLLARNWQAGVTNPTGQDLGSMLSSLGLPSVPEPTALLASLALLSPALGRMPRRQRP
jgi:hypothetical protein